MEQKTSSHTLHLIIAGMHCASCELLLERKFRALPGVLSAHVNHRKGTAKIVVDPNHTPDAQTIELIVTEAHYRFLGLSTSKDLSSKKQSASSADDVPAHQRWLEIGGSLIIILAIYQMLKSFDIVSLAPSTAGALTYGGVLVIGLVAGASSSLAVTGGLLLAMAAKYHEVHQSQTPWQKFQPLLHFNIGRIVSYVLLGGVVGLIGQSITLSANITGYMNITIAIVMIYLALTILRIIPRGTFPIRPPKALS
ncbi:MAG: sulfite exporter TauE/SafE family protein, partial [Candidatus Peribacteraceae bacterium]|nr:sulfite exporter TauE/SafE family protein [Candidatus Peribacteraceae bacterium]